MSIHAMHKSTIMPCLNAIAYKYCPRSYYYSTSKTFVKVETQLWPGMKVKVAGLKKYNNNNNNNSYLCSTNPTLSSKPQTKIIINIKIQYLQLLHTHTHAPNNTHACTDYLHSKLDGHCLKVSEIIKHLLFSWLRSVWLEWRSRSI